MATFCPSLYRGGIGKNIGTIKYVVKETQPKDWSSFHQTRETKILVWLKAYYVEVCTKELKFNM